MNFVDTIILGSIYITFPFLVYILYIAYNKNINKKENDFYLDLALFCSLYLIMRFCNNNILFLCINTTLIFAMIKNRIFVSFGLSLIIIVYYGMTNKFSFIFSILEYCIYFLIYYKLKNQNNKNRNFIFIFMLLKSLWFIFYVFYYNIFDGTNIIILTKSLILILIFYIITYFVLWISSISDDIIKYHMNVKELEQQKQIRSTLFKITHEIKNPIAVCKGYLDMYDVNNIDHSKKYIPVIKDEINKVLLLLQDFLSMTKINISKDVMDINYMLENVINSFKHLVKSNNIKLKFDIEEDEFFINGDYNRLTQVMINIIKNAIEALDGIKNPKIEVSTKFDNKYFYIYVIDNGVGITKEEILKIKEGFYTTKKNGTGLGVSLSNEIIKAHKGELNYTSNKKGTTVEVKVPIDL